ncbi:MAG: hypothetical protein R2724_27670 [Bryobacterales bacterium]
MPVVAGLAVSLSHLLNGAEAERRRRGESAADNAKAERADESNESKPQDELVRAARERLPQPVANS